ncbi:MAG: ATPase [Paludibacteraceae bacterium]|nr:ATPase [Paludibacteraceae bacterium]MBR0296768.1 ATPase [Paludibacteraceae bacterium]
MILIADSGSTKTHWSLMTANGHHQEYKTDGINPMLQSEDDIYRTISDQLLPQVGPQLWAGEMTHIYFYGAGCTPEKKELVANALQGIFKHGEAVVASDMLGAARALFGRQKGIACILGTGSGSCFYDGEKIEWSVPSLGYVLGDEGSAATLGKRLVGDVLKNLLGEDLKTAFLTEYNLTQADILDHVYKQPFPNRWLANLARFCHEHLEDDRIYRMVYEHFDSFVTRNLTQYYDYLGVTGDWTTTSKMRVGFVGSVAHYYFDVLRNVMAAHNYPIAGVLQEPIEGLITYHQKDVNPTT